MKKTVIDIQDYDFDEDDCVKPLLFKYDGSIFSIITSRKEVFLVKLFERSTPIKLNNLIFTNEATVEMTSNLQILVKLFPLTFFRMIDLSTWL